MKTASFQTYTGPGRVSIARFAPRNTPAGFRIYKTLAPGVWFNTVERVAYERLFAQQLAALNPQAVVDRLMELAGGHEPVLLCWEKPPFTETNWCHRRIVAAWLGNTMGIEVDEWEPPAILQPPGLFDGSRADAMSYVWWFSLPDWGSGSTFRFSAPVSRSTARLQVLAYFGWDRLPRGAELSEAP